MSASIEREARRPEGAARAVEMSSNSARPRLYCFSNDVGGLMLTSCSTRHVVVVFARGANVALRHFPARSDRALCSARPRAGALGSSRTPCRSSRSWSADRTASAFSSRWVPGRRERSALGTPPLPRRFFRRERERVSPRPSPPLTPTRPPPSPRLTPPPRGSSQGRNDVRDAKADVADTRAPSRTQTVRRHNRAFDLEAEKEKTVGALGVEAGGEMKMVPVPRPWEEPRAKRARAWAGIRRWFGGGGGG